MANQDQFGIPRPLLASAAAGMKHAPDPAPGIANPSQSEAWARQLPGNGSRHERGFFAQVDRRWVHLSYVLIDIFLISVNGLLAFYIRFVPLSRWHVLPTVGPGLAADFSSKPYGGFLLLYAILILLFCESQDLYRTRRGRTAAQESWGVLWAVTLATFLLAAFVFCTSAKFVSRSVVGISALLNVATLVLWRVGKRHFVTRQVAQGIGARNALIVGTGELGQWLAAYLEQNKQLGYRVTGFLDVDQRSDPHVLGRIEDLPRVARAQFVDEIFVTIPSERELVKKVAAEGRRQHLNVKVVPELYDGLGRYAPIHNLGELPVMELHREPIPSLGLFIKRMADVVLSAIALVVCAPLFLLIAIAIKLDSPGPVFYKSKRIGKKGTIFNCYKFRTMVSNADELKKGLHHLNERSNALLFKISDDPRITRLGRFLRQYSLDELPQVWSVVRGEMSLVGPRPPLPSEFNQYSLEHLRRLDVKPGITGLWQVTGRLDPSFDNYLALDLEYIEKWSFLMDLTLLLKTIPAVLKGQGR